MNANTANAGRAHPFFDPWLFGAAGTLLLIGIVILAVVKPF